MENAESVTYDFEFEEGVIVMDCIELLTCDVETIRVYPNIMAINNTSEEQLNTISQMFPDHEVKVATIDFNEISQL